jgi:CheY-like chemotaxis protein
MNGVIGMLELMLKMPLDAKLRRYAEAADSSASALLVIINDVLDFSKMEAGKYELSSVPYDPELVLREVADLVASRAHQKGLELVCHRIDEVPEWVVGDPDRYRQILNNLIGNAVKFTAQGEVYVELSCKREPGRVPLLKTIVQDTGIGIAPEHHHKLFEAFSQVDGSMGRTYGGTGLGLAISRRLVEMMGGQIGVVSERGVGSQFWFTIPMSAAGARVIEPVIGAMVGKHAMIVESNRRWCRVIADYLGAWGLTSAAFVDGDSALLAGDDRRRSGGGFDVAIVAAPLTDMSIEVFVARLREQASPTETPLIVLTQLGRS